MEILCRMDGFCLNPLHFFQDAHCIVVGFPPHHAGADYHMVIRILMPGCHCGASVLILLLGLNQIRHHCLVLAQELIIILKFPCIFLKTAQKDDHVGIDGFTQTVILCKACKLIIRIFTYRRIVIGHIHHGPCPGFLTILCRCHDFLCVPASGGEYTDRILGELLMSCGHELGCNHAVCIDIRCGVQPVLHGQ